MMYAAITTNRCYTKHALKNSDSNCPAWETPYKYCKLDTGKTEGKCLDKTIIPLDGTSRFSNNAATATLTEACENGFKYMGPNGNIEGAWTNRFCQKIAAIGCTVSNDDADNAGNGKVTCARNSVFQAQGNDQQCTRNANNVGIAVEGRTCDILKDGVRQTCGHNLVCTTNNVCKRENDIGGSCGTQFDTCLSGLICHKWQCIPPYSLDLGQPCDKTITKTDGENVACKTGYCGPSFTCEHTETQQPCYRNADCAGSTRSVCIGADPDNKKKGTCSASFQLARSTFYNCAYRVCNQHVTESYSQESASACLTTGVEGNKYCSTDYARYMCSKYCAMDPDRRQSALHLSDESWVENGEIPFKFDCKELTVTKLTNQDCDISSFFDNCESFKDYPSAATRTVATTGCLMIISIIALLFL